MKIFILITMEYHKGQYSNHYAFTYIAIKRVHSLAALPVSHHVGPGPLNFLSYLILLVMVVCVCMYTAINARAAR